MLESPVAWSPAMPSLLTRKVAWPGREFHAWALVSPFFSNRIIDARVSSLSHALYKLHAPNNSGPGVSQQHSATSPQQCDRPGAR